MLADTLADDAPVLVAVLPTLRDLAIVRSEGWYRIPVARAPRQLAAEALAFYQTKVFGAERWSVRYAAAVHGVRVVPRAVLLPDEPDHPRAAERYFCFQLGLLETLPFVVPSKRLRRISFIPTTFGQLRWARDVAELWAQPAAPAENGLWSAGLAGKHIRTGPTN